MNEDYDAIKNNENYLKWRRIHAATFGDIFEDAFEGNSGAQVMLTSALIKITEKNTASALEMLGQLMKLCDTDWDRATVSYFSGLCCEIAGDAKGAERFYDELVSASVNFSFPNTFQPYYRTAKLSQQGSECTKAINYYKKVLSFYENAEPTANNKRQASQIIYDIATVCLYSHQYALAQSYLELSREYCADINWQREYVQAILYALGGKTEQCSVLTASMPELLKQSCVNIISAIESRSELHYFVVEQNRDTYDKFWLKFSREEKRLLALVREGKTEEAECIVSVLLTQAMPFARRTLECKIEECNGKIIVKCKNYHIKTLISEYEFLFSNSSAEILDFCFVSVSEFGE
jgi:tetratricopeptide (TPR) repeat protein